VRTGILVRIKSGPTLLPCTVGLERCSPCREGISGKHPAPASQQNGTTSSIPCPKPIFDKEPRKTSLPGMQYLSHHQDERVINEVGCFTQLTNAVRNFVLLLLVIHNQAIIQQKGKGIKVERKYRGYHGQVILYCRQGVAGRIEGTGSSIKVAIPTPTQRRGNTCRSVQLGNVPQAGRDVVFCNKPILTRRGGPVAGVVLRGGGSESVSLRMLLLVDRLVIDLL
jgi:hypothetical protein